ncbi:very short patch repair endonuclease [Alicyclobacillus tolerans]|uniref:Very short patch repair endonuclease n=1 Tax=Alicyclobacillus tolerans TaxID=90970 RepID=A0A1M6Y6F1_9BACL|nr:very short patch repair endonuclease [Alicyclobacillus montanus]SHL13555.1 T/G mismatch-specific endonuclease [Alicyclobacillus montanus]
MTDNVSRRRRSEIMSAVRSNNTSLELRVRRELWRRGFQFRTNVKDLPGKPDIAIKKLKLVIFIDSCFWHGCPEHVRMPKSNVEYWTTKIEKNKTTDKTITEHYQAMGWHIVRIWEHDVKSNFENTMDKLVKVIRKLKQIPRP